MYQEKSGNPGWLLACFVHAKHRHQGMSKVSMFYRPDHETRLPVLMPVCTYYMNKRGQSLNGLYANVQEK
jgi:hypothetical protein